MNRFGVLLDWPKQYFTMDANFTLAVNTAFMRLYDDGLIVRDTMLVNWYVFVVLMHVLMTLFVGAQRYALPYPTPKWRR